MSELKFTCFKCEKENFLQQGFSRREECLHCGTDVHSCKNCRFYDKSAHNECREPSADYVQDKERANFCDYFQLKGSDGTTGPSKNDLLSAAEALFKK